MARPVVLVTEPEFLRGRATFERAAEVACISAPSAEDALVQAIRETGAKHVIVGSTPYRGPLYDAIPKGSVVARYGVGHESIDKTKATEAGVFCTNTPGVLDQSVAEITLLFILAAARHLSVRDREMRAGEWTPGPGLELEGKTVAVIGTGPIGRAVGRAARHGFGMRTIGCGRSRTPGVAPAAAILADADFDETTRDFAAAVRGADFVSLHIPGSPENVRFLDRERLSLLGRTTWLVNTARGAVVDERALYDALAAGQIAGAALDVFEREPYVPIDAAHDLRTLPNVILTPHIGSNTADANRRMAERALRNVYLAEARRYEEMDLLNREMLG